MHKRGEVTGIVDDEMPERPVQRGGNGQCAQYHKGVNGYPFFGNGAAQPFGGVANGEEELQVLPAAGDHQLKVKGEQHHGQQYYEYAKAGEAADNALQYLFHPAEFCFVFIDAVVFALQEAEELRVVGILCFKEYPCRAGMVGIAETFVGPAEEVGRHQYGVDAIAEGDHVATEGLRSVRAIEFQLYDDGGDAGRGYLRQVAAGGEYGIVEFEVIG